MRVFITIVFWCVMGLCASVSASAQGLPDEVLKPYRAYTAAQENGDEKAMIKHAKAAWLAAEKHLGDHKTTGDLANNYAVQPKAKWDRDRKRAFSRAVELAELHEEDPGIRAIERQIQYVEFAAANSWLSESDFRNTLNTGFKLIKNYGLEGSTFEGELLILRGVYRTRNGSDKSALEDIEKGIEITETATDGYFTVYPYMGKLYRADVLRNDNKDLEAALAYQEVMQNVEGELPADHPYVSRAFGEWMSLRFDFEEKGELESAEQAGLCQCWPFDEFKKKLQPIKRVPPIMPRNAERSGHANVMFDLDDSGKPINIRVISSTEVVFERPSIKAVEQWIYSPISEEANPDDRKDIATKVTYKLVDRSGKEIPSR